MQRLVLAIILSYLMIVVDCAGAAPDKPEIFVQLGHQGWLRTGSFSSDGNYLVMGDNEKGVTLWDVGSGMEVRSFIGHQDEISAVAVSSKGTMVISGDAKGALKLWDVTTGNELKAFSAGSNDHLTSLAFSPDDRFVTSVGTRSKMRIWEVSTGRLVKTIDNLSYPRSGESVVIAHDDSKNVALLELSTAKFMRELGTGFLLIRSFSQDGRYGLSVHCTNEKKCFFETFDLHSQNRIATWSSADDSYSSFHLSTDGRYALSAGSSGLKLWDAQQGSLLKDLTTSLTQGVVVSPDGRYFLSYGEYNPTLWEFPTGNDVRSFAGRPLHRFDSAIPALNGRLAIIRQAITHHSVAPATMNMQTGAVGKVLNAYTGVGPLSADGRHLLLLGNKKVTLWNLETDKVVRVLAGKAADFSLDGKYLIEYFGDNEIKISEVDTGRLILRHIETSGVVLNAQLRMKNQFLLIRLADQIKLVNAKSLDDVKTLKIPGSKHINRVDISPDGRYLVAIYQDDTPYSLGKINGEYLWIWDMHEQRKVADYNGVIQAPGFRISPDGKSVLFAYDRSVLLGSKIVRDDALALCDLATGRVVRTFAEKRVRPWSIMKFSGDGKSIFTGDSDGMISIWDVASGREKTQFIGHRAAVTSATLLPDAKRLITSADDGTTRFWDVNTGKEVAQFARFTDGEWIIITDGGYYNASTNGDKYLNVRVGNKVYSIENYREAFFRPDLVKLALSGGTLQGYRTLADVKQPPMVNIVQTSATTNSQDFKLTLRLEERDGGIGDVRLFLNGSAIMLDSSRSLKAVDKNSRGVYYRSYSIKLSPGSNTIRVVASNAENTMQSNEALHQVTASFSALRKPTLHALVIGIQEFRNPKLQLKYAVADALLFADTLRKGSADLFDQISVTSLTTRDVTTRENITRTLEKLRSINPDDLFILYIASHGTVDDGEYFLITSNVSALSSHRLKTDALSQVQLKELVANIPSTKKLIILDTCNAAALGDAMQVAMLTRGMSEETAIKVLSRAVGSTILSASTSVQEALEGYQGHGLFTWALVQGLLGKADKGRTGFVRTTDLATYVEDEVPAISERVFKRVQQPSASMNGQSFPVSRVR